MPLSFVFIQFAESIDRWTAANVVFDIKMMPGIGSVEAAKLAVNDDQHGAVTNPHQLMDKWLLFHPEEGPESVVIAQEGFVRWLEAKGVGVDDTHRDSICMGVAANVLSIKRTSGT
jgi:hypothetical protein